jgi:GNAT superfamily N-acetyltransferase
LKTEYHREPWTTVIALIADEPRWVEIRSLLLSGHARVEVASTTPPAFVVVRPDVAQGGVVGRPPHRVIQAMAADAEELLVEPEHAEWVAQALPGWTCELAMLHVLGGARRLPHVASGLVRPVSRDEMAGWREIPDDLREELCEAGAETPVFVAFAGERPAAFCYAGAVTESLWDVSIDTLEPYRRQGYATRCAAFVIEQMRAVGKEPVWGSLISNVASARLAAKLGFVPVDTIFVFVRPNLV